MICGLPALEVARVRVLGADQKKRGRGFRVKQEFLSEELCDFLILDCLFRFFLSNLKFVWPHFIEESIARHCIAYGCINRSNNPKCAKLSREASIQQL